jgi:hypothetical protein
MKKKTKNISRWKIIISSIALLVLLLFSGSTQVQADDYNCTGTLGSITVDNLNVPQNATCTLNSTRVEGNVFVRSGATLYANSVYVDGNIQAEHAARVEIHLGSFVGGNIQVDESGPLVVDWVHIGGNLQAFDNYGSQAYSDNTIGGDLQSFYNTGGVTIWDNVIDGNLQCQGIVPPPTGENNVVGGNMEDQCADLQPGVPPPDDPSPGDDETCTGTLGSITVENLNVPQNTTCTLNSTRVEGNIFVWRSMAHVDQYCMQVERFLCRRKYSGRRERTTVSGLGVHSDNTIGGDLQVTPAV